VGGWREVDRTGADLLVGCFLAIDRCRS